MEEHERALTEHIYHRDFINSPSRHIAFQALLGTEAVRFPVFPNDPFELAQCIELTDRIPQARDALAQLAGRSPHWRVLHRHWDNLREMLSEETDGKMVIPWAYRTSLALRHLNNQATFNMNDEETLDRIEMPTAEMLDSARH